MALHFTFKHTQPTEALKRHLEKKVAKLDRFVEYPMEIHVFLSVQKEVHTVEIKCHAEHQEMAANHKSKDLYESIDQVVHKLEAQLKKEREKRKGHAKVHRSVRKKVLKQAEAVGAEIPHREKKALLGR